MMAPPSATVANTITSSMAFGMMCRRTIRGREAPPPQGGGAAVHQRALPIWACAVGPEHGPVPGDCEPWAHSHLGLAIRCEPGYLQSEDVVGPGEDRHEDEPQEDGEREDADGV